MIRIITLSILPALLLTYCDLALSEDRLLTDASAFQPAKAISPEETSNTWRLVTDKESPSGWRLQTTVNTNAPDIELPLNVSGPHAVYIGIFMPDTLTSGVLVGEEKDPYFVFIRGRSDGKYPAYHEILYKVIDCTDNKLIIRQPAEARSYITHVRLEPRDKIPEMPVATREVYGLSDVWHYYFFFSSREPDCIDTLYKTHQLCGFTDISIEAGRSCMIYETKVGTVYRYHKKRPRTKWLRYHVKRHQPFARSLKAAEDLGLNLNARLCMNMHYYKTWDGSATGQFHVDHPEYWEKNQDGSKRPNQLCFGYKAVRDERVSIFRELVELGAPRITLDCMIYAPVASWGTPYIEGFQKKFGVDPRTLKESDPLWKDWIQYRASTFTQLMHEIHAMLKDVGHPEVKVDIRIDDKGTQHTLNTGIDIKKLVEEKLIDRIILGGDYPPRIIKEKIIREYQELLDGTDIKLLPCLRTHGWPPMPGPEHHSKGDWPSAMYFCPDVLKRAENVDRMYDLGVDGVAFYESDRGCLYPELREFFIACRTPESIKAFVAKMRESKNESESTR